MADPSFLSGFIGVGIDMAIRQIIHHVGIAVRCKEELESLRNLVTIIEPMVSQIHRCQQKQMLTEMPRESTQASTSTSTTGTSEGLAPTAGGFFIQEPLIVGQEKDFTALEMWVIDADVKPLFCMGVVGKGGSGKTLKSLFSSQKVRDFFSDGFLVWFTVSQSPSFKSLRDKFYRQIAMQIKEELVQNMKEEDAKL